MANKLSLILLLLLLASCSKEQRINRKLDGEWVATTYFGTAPSSHEEYFFHLSKDTKDTGDGFLRISEGSSKTTLGISYYMVDDDITMIIDSDAYSFTIKSYSRRKIELVDTYGLVTILEKD